MIVKALSSKRDLGNAAEKRAEKYLLKQGLRTVARNYRCRYGEVDLIMADDDALVFIEVRYRQHKTHGSALETVTSQKQHKIIKAAQHYLLSKSITERPIRFDVVGIEQESFNWIKGAFY